MKTKLTLSVDDKLVHFARRKAQAEKTSISAMFSEYMDMQRTQSKINNEFSVKAMTGILKEYKIDDSKQSIRSSYAQKHLH